MLLLIFVNLLRSQPRCWAVLLAYCLRYSHGRAAIGRGWGGSIIGVYHTLPVGASSMVEWR